MGRELRHEEPWGTYHVWGRGSDRQRIVIDVFDRVRYVTQLEAATVRFGWTLLAWCLMKNHYHLLLRIRETGLSNGMKWLNGGFSRSFNVRHGRDAHLFRNRFSSKLIETEEQLLSTCRYIARNPLDAGACRSLDTYRWSSFRACAGVEPAPAFLACREVWALFGAPEENAAQRYRAFVAAPDDPLTRRP
jgi:putative transposase